MIRVTPGQAYPFELDASVAGIAADLTLRVENSADVVVVAASGAGIAEFAVGHYRKTLTIPGLPGGYYDAIWRHVSTGKEGVEQFRVVGVGEVVTGEGYPSTADLVAASTVDELADLSTDQKDELREAAIDAIEVHCRQAFTLQAAATKVVDGSGGDVLYLPVRLQAVTALSVDGTLMAVPDYSLGTDGDVLKLVSPVGGSWVTRVRRSPGDGGPSFPSGRDNVSITGDWGWAEVPSAVATAIRFDMEDQALAEANKLASTVRSQRALGVYSINQGGLSAQLQGEPGLSVRVKRKLARYRWRAAGVVV